MAEGAFRPICFIDCLWCAWSCLRCARVVRICLFSSANAAARADAGMVGPNLDRLNAHTWPGNLRELRNVIDRAIALSPGAQSFAELRVHITPQAADEALTVRTDLPFTEAKAAVLQTFELRYLRDVLSAAKAISAAARQSGLNGKTPAHLAAQVWLGG